eukprot:scaffold12210_cov33-Phaeocystis_antarctica.AAC.1
MLHRMPRARPRSPRGERPSSASPASPARNSPGRPASPRARERPDAAPASPRVRNSSTPAVGSGAPGPRRPSAMSRPPLAPSARPPCALSGLDLDTPNSVRSEDTDDTPESTERSGGADTLRRKPMDKEKEKDPSSSRVRVTVRVRPEVSDREQGTGHLLCQGGWLWLVEGGKDANGGGGSGGMVSPRGNKESTRQFVFDAALPSLTTQEEVFNATCLETGVLKGVTEGFNGCVMCYGQTGAGKTHTLGNAAAGQEGIVPRVLRYLLDEE